MGKIRRTNQINSLKIGPFTDVIQVHIAGGSSRIFGMEVKISYYSHQNSKLILAPIYPLDKNNIVFYIKGRLP